MSKLNSFLVRALRTSPAIVCWGSLSIEVFAVNLTPPPTIVLEKVSFAGDDYYELKSDDLTETYSAPHWIRQDGTNESVAFKRDSIPEVEALFSMDVSDELLEKIKIKGIASDGVKFPEQTPVKVVDGVKYPMEKATSAFPDIIKFYDRSEATKSFTIDWQMSVDGADFTSIEKSKHQVYLTLNEPIKVAGATENQETLFNLGCRNADGATASGAAVQKIWTEFSDRIVSRVTPQTGKADLDLNKGGGKPDGMIYWKPGITSCRTVEEFLKIGHTSCGTWARFMRACLNFQGIEGAQLSVVTSPTPLNFNQSTIDYKAHANFGGSVYYSSYKNRNGNNVPNNLNNGDRVLTFQTDNDVNGGVFYVKQLNLGGQKFVVIPANAAGFPNSSSQAQGNKNAKAWFGNHAIIKYAGEYYDPSYGGNLFATKKAWEDASLQHFGGLIQVLEYNAPNNSFAPIDSLLWIEQDDTKGVLNTTISNP